LRRLATGRLFRTNTRFINHFSTPHTKPSFARGFCSGPSLIELVKQLRKETKAGIADCRDALIASNNNLDAAKDWLVEKAKITAAKKSGRLAQDGNILALASGSKGLLVELSCETDFAAREPEFVKAIRAMSESLINSYPVLVKDDTVKTALELGHKSEVAGFAVSTIAEAVQQLTFLFKENVLLRRVLVLPLNDATDKPRSIYSYVHSPVDNLRPQVGKVGCLIELTTSAEPNLVQANALKKLGDTLCIQIVGGKPILLDGDKSAPRLKTVDNCDFINEPDFEPRLLEQDCIISDGTVKELIQQCEAATGLTIKIENFARWNLNAGEEKEQADLAADIKSLLNKE